MLQSILSIKGLKKLKKVSQVSILGGKRGDGCIYVPSYRTCPVGYGRGGLNLCCPVSFS